MGDIRTSEEHLLIVYHRKVHAPLLEHIQSQFPEARVTTYLPGPGESIPKGCDPQIADQRREETYRSDEFIYIRAMERRDIACHISPSPRPRRRKKHTNHSYRLCRTGPSPLTPHPPSHQYPNNDQYRYPRPPSSRMDSYELARLSPEVHRHIRSTETAPLGRHQRIHACGQ